MTATSKERRCIYIGPLRVAISLPSSEKDSRQRHLLFHPADRHFQHSLASSAGGAKGCLDPVHPDILLEIDSYDERDNFSSA